MPSLGLTIGNRNEHALDMRCLYRSRDLNVLIFDPENLQLGKYPMEITSFMKKVLCI